MSELKGFVPIEDVARYFRVSISTIRMWARTNKIPANTYIKLGNTYRFSIPKVEEALLLLGATEIVSEEAVESGEQLELDFEEGKDPDTEDNIELDITDDIDFLNDEIGLFDEDI